MLELTQEQKEEIISTLKISAEDRKNLGGQHVAVYHPPIVFQSDEIGIELKISQHRSPYKNRQLGIEIYKLILEHLTNSL